MRNGISKRIISLLMAAVFCLTGVVVFADTETVEADKYFLKARDFLQTMQLIDEIGTDNLGGTVSRATAAGIFLQAFGYKEGGSNTVLKADGNKFLGFTNDPDFDENGDWVWKDGSATSAGDDVTVTSGVETPFKDVLTTFTEWEDIRLAAVNGIMRGDTDGYFRPYEPILSMEAVKIMVEACGAKFMADGQYPDGYIRAAKKMGLLDGFSNMDMTANISLRDFVVLIYEGMHTEMYEQRIFEEDYVGVVNMEGETLLSYLYDVFQTDGIVTVAGNSGLTTKDNDTGEEDAIRIGNQWYEYNGGNMLDILGKDVDAYYTEDGTIKTIVCLQVDDDVNEYVVDSESIDNYVGKNLQYWKNDKIVEQYIGVDTNVIYNGKACSNITPEDIKLMDGELQCEGEIRLVDGDGNGSFETVFITKSNVYVIDVIDKENKVIYDRISNEQDNTKVGIDLSGDNVTITDVDGMEMSLDDLTEGLAVAVTVTKETQGEPLTTVVVSGESVSGKISNIKVVKRELTIDGVQYKVSPRLNIEALDTSYSGAFLLDPYGKLLYFTKENAMKYGYLMVYDPEDLGFGKKDYKVRMYDIASDAILTLGVRKHLSLDGKSGQTADAVITKLTTENAGKFDQMVKYEANSNNELTKIISTRYDDEQLYKCTTEDINPYNSSGSAKSWNWRSGLKGFANSGSNSSEYVYLTTTGQVINLPATDASNEDAYYRAELVHNRSTSGYVEFYKDNKNDADYSVVVKRADEGGVGGKVPDTQMLSIVTSVEKSLAGEEDAYMITVGTTSGEVKLVVDEYELFDICADLSIGDVVRYQKSSINGRVTRLEKTFDINRTETSKGSLTMTEGKNPVGGSMAQLSYMHGVVSESFSNGTYINVNPYKYTAASVNTGELDYSVNTMIKASKFSVYVCDLDNISNPVRVGSYATDILDAKRGEGSEIIYCTNYSDTKTIFVYK